MPRPVETLQWANDDIVETKTINGSEETLPNKVEPTQEFADSGLLYRENLPRPYLNFFLNLVCKYIAYLEEITDISALTAKATPVDADTFVLSDSADADALKKVTWANIKATLETYFGTQYQPLSAVLTATTASFLTADETKLDGIETAADVTDAVNVGSSIHGAAAKTTLVDADHIPLIDSAASNALKKITVANLRSAMGGSYSAVVPTTSGTEIDFTGIPTWVTRIEMLLEGVSTNPSAQIRWQLGDAGGVETTDYISASSYMGSDGVGDANITTASFLLGAPSSGSAARYGRITFTLLDPSTNTWEADGLFYADLTTEYVADIVGTKSLSGPLDRVRLMADGSDTFDAGKVVIKMS